MIAETSSVQFGFGPYHADTASDNSPFVVRPNQTFEESLLNAATYISHTLNLVHQLRSAGEPTSDNYSALEAMLTPAAALVGSMLEIIDTREIESMAQSKVKAYDVPSEHT